MADGEILESINSLNSKQHVSNVVHNWAREYAKHKDVNVQPVHIFTGTSHMVKAIYQPPQKPCCSIAKNQEPKKPRVLLLRPTGISEGNIGGATLNFPLGIKPGAKLLGLSDKLKASFRNELSEVKLLMITEISTVSSGLWINIDASLFKIFSASIDLPITCILVVVVGDYFQPLFSRFTSGGRMNQLFHYNCDICLDVRN